MSLQDLLRGSENGVVELRGKHFILDSPLVLTSPICISGGGDCELEFQTPSGIPALQIHSDKVSLHGLTIRQKLEKPGINDLCVEVRGSEISISDCKIEFSKRAVGGSVGSLRIENTHFHNVLPKESVNVVKAVVLDRIRGEVIVRGCKHTTEGNPCMEGFVVMPRSGSSKGGRILYENNFTEGFLSNRKWINFDVGAEIGLNGESLQMEIRNNRLESTSSAMLVIQPAFSKSLYRFEEIVVENNQLNSQASIVEINAIYSGCSTLGEPESSTPLIRFYQNQGYDQPLKLVGYKTIPKAKIWEEGVKKSISREGEDSDSHPREETPLQKKNILGTSTILIILGVIFLALIILYLTSLSPKRTPKSKKEKQ